MSSIKIYTCHHKPSAFLDSSMIQPIHVGKANNPNEIGCPGDDTGDNISFKNPFYCELTAHYWVWKNAQPADYVGFMHYRRHFNFSKDQQVPEDNWGVVNYERIDASYHDKFGLNDKDISLCLMDVDILLPKKWDVSAAGSKNNYHHYKVSNYLHIEDYDAALEILADIYPEYSSAADKFNNATDGYYTNMFVMRKDIFNDYSKWLFTILERLEDKLRFKNYNSQEKRVVGHISERLLNIYIAYQIEQHAFKVKELQRTFIEQETFNATLKPIFATQNVPVVICFDDNYSISGAALINSIVKHASSELNYDLIILENGISLSNKRRLLSLVADVENFSLRFFDVNAFSEIKSVFTRAHFSSATYARLFIPKLFSEFDKVIFIDADTVVESDLAELMTIRLGNNLVAAVKDIVMEGFVLFGAMSQSSDGVMPAKEYLSNSLGMVNPDGYFQAGILVFNIDLMNKENTFSNLMDAMKSKTYWFLDQDIMNKVFHGRVHYLPLEWNVYHGNGNTEDFFPNLPFKTYMDYLEARRKPKMIHFAGENKPWNTRHVDFFDNYHKNIVNTPWALEAYERLIGASVSHAPAAQLVNNTPVLLQTKLKRALMPTFNKWAPKGTSRRNFMTKYYYKVRRVILG
ncbi:General stress protein A [Serratia quinivorans]|nr:General stress protein A [Serratia quinivorans]